MNSEINYKVFDYLTKKDVDAVIVHYRHEHDRQIKFSENEIDTNKVWLNEAVDFFIAKDGKTIGAGISIPDSDQKLKEILDNYYKTLMMLSPSPFYRDIFAGPQPTYPNINSSKAKDKKFDSITVEVPDLVNLSIDESLRAGSKRNAGTLFFGELDRHLLTSKGIDITFSQTYWDYNIRAMDEGTDQTGTANIAGSILSEQGPEMLTNCGRQAGETCKKMTNAKQGTAGTYDVILSPYVSADVLSSLPGQANPIAVMFGFSGLKDKIGEQLAPEFVTITDHPTKEFGNSFNPFDFEGVPTKELPIIDKGILKNFVHNTSTALMFDAQSTGNSFLGDSGGGLRMLAPGNHAINFKPGTDNLDDLINYNTKPVIYIQNTWYKRFTNILEGIFSTIPRDGLFLIQNGKWQPIKKLRISDNLYNVMKNIQSIGNDTQCVKWWDEYQGWYPHVRIADVRLTAATK